MKGGPGDAQMAGIFDFAAGLDNFDKDKVAVDGGQQASEAVVAYEKDDFFDNLSNDIADREQGKRRMTASEERNLNQDTFGAISVQHRRYSNYRGRGRGGGRGGGRGRGGRTGRGEAASGAAVAKVLA